MKGTLPKGQMNIPVQVSFRLSEEVFTSVWALNYNTIALGRDCCLLFFYFDNLKSILKENIYTFIGREKP